MYFSVQYSRVLGRSGSSSCDPGYNLVGSKCVRVFPGPANYLAAITSCTQAGAVLATINSQAEQDAVFALTGSAGAWIGLTDFLDEGRDRSTYLLP